MVNTAVGYPPTPLRIYGASCLSHANSWQDIFRKWDEFHWTARWPDITQGLPQAAPLSPASYESIWAMDLRDIEDSDVVMLFANLQDNLRGAIFEAGYGYACGKLLLLCGENQGFGTWQFSAGTLRVKTPAEARLALNLHAMSAKRVHQLTPQAQA